MLVRERLPNLAVVPEHIDADDGLLEGGVCGLHQVVVYVLSIAQRIQALRMGMQG